jgi:predicted transcriptional regulator
MVQAVQLPDGRYFPIKDGERPEEAYRVAMQLHPEAFAQKQPAQPQPEAEGGFFPALKAGYSALKSDIAGLAGRSGLMDLAEAEKYIAEQKKYQAETFKPTTEGFAEAPLTNIKELLGGSLPYMAAPLVAGGAAAVAAPASAVAGVGAAGLASLAQFTGSNLSRQVEDGGKKLGETDLTNAALAAIPQTALDIISLRMIPGLGKVLEGAGIKLAKEEVKNFAEDALKKTATDYALKTGRTMGVEGLTEASQQIFERAQAGLNITDPEARQEYFDSFIGGAVLGGVVAPAGRYIERGQAQKRYDIGEAVKQQTAQQEQLKLDALALAEEEQKKSSPEYFETLSTEYKAAEKAKNDLIAQKRKIVTGSDTETADRLHNTELSAQLKEMMPKLTELGSEYNRLLKMQSKEEEAAPEKEQVSLAVGDTLDNPLGNFTKEELSSRAPTVAAYIDTQRKEAGKPALETYSIEDIRNAMPNQLPEAEQADLSSLIAAKTGHTGDITYKPTDVIEVAKQKNIDTTTDGFKDFLRRATGDSEIETFTQPQLHSAFKALSSLPKFDQPQILPQKRNAVDYSQDQYNNAVTGLQKLVEERKADPIAKPVSIAESNEVIKAQTGLKNDADIKALFRDANRNGDIDFKGDEVTYQPKGAQAEFNIEEGFAPAEGTGFNVMRDGKPLYSTNSEAEATAKAEKLGKDAAPAIQQIDRSIAKEQATVTNSQKALDVMEAEGKFNTPQYTQAAARHAGVVDKVNTNIAGLNSKKQMLLQPVTVQAAGKPTNRKIFTVKEKGVEEKAFNTREEAERHALENLPEERLNELSTKTKAPGFANRLKKEQERRKKPVLALPAPAPKGPSAEATALHAKLLPMLRKFGLGDVALKIEEAMQNEGEYSASVIKVALDATNPLGVLRHEVIHGLKDLGFFTPGQWKILENKADKEWTDKYLRQRNVDGGPLKAGEQSRYDAYDKEYNGDVDAIREEAISDAFRDFDVNGAPKGLFAQLLNAMRKFFRALRSALNGAGYETAEDIFGKVERGELKATKAAESKEAKPSLRTAEEGVPFSTRAIMEQNTAFAQNELGLETVKKKGAANSNNVRDVAIALNNKTLQEYGRMDEKNHSPEDVQRIADAMADEVSYQLTTKSKTGTGTGWYSHNYPNAVKRLAARFPELAESQYARSVFSALVAVTSNGERVDKNIDNAIKLYADLRMGKPLVAMGNRRPTALEKNLIAIQSLMNEHGEENFENELRREITVREMNVFLRSKGEKTNNDYLANSRVPAAAIYFGPKLGAFYANLSGSEGYLTMDLWWTRSINRMRGLLIPRATEASIGKFREMMGMPEATREEVVAASIPLRNKYKEYGYTTELEHLVRSKEPDTNAKKPAWTAKAKRVAGSAYPQLEFEHRLEKMANTIHKNEYEMLEEAPFGAGDRRFMYDAAKKAQSILAKDGIKLTLADIQAALWYYEKRLYAKLTGRIADDIGYEEAIIAKSREGTGRERPSVVFSGQPYRRDVGAGESQLPDERGQGDDQKRASLRTAIQSYRGRNEESPDSHTRRGFRDGEGLRVLGRESIAAYAPTEDFKNTVGEFDHQSPTFYEMNPKDADVFRGAIEKSKSNSKYGAAVGVYSEEEYAKMRTFLTQDGKAGFALKGNDIVSVFSSPEHKGSASSSLQLAVQEGGRKLDAFDTILPPMYYENGFKVTGRSRWNEEYIPDNWNKQTFQKFNNGEPDVVYMVYDPENDTPPSVKSPDQYFEDYDDLIKAQDDAVEKYFNEGVGYGTKEQNQRAREFKAEAERLPKQGGVRRSVRLLDDETRAKYPYVEKPVEGLPAKAKVDGVEVTFGPYVPAREAAILHAEQSGIPYRQQASYYKIDPAFSKRLANAFLQMKDNPSAPEVKAAYDAWADETIAQYKAMLKTGITIEFMPNNRDPYGNPRNAILDVINNNHLYVFPADGGFGSAAITEEQIKKNPALALTDIIISGRPARVVEVFRATHDFYGHIKEGFGFRAEGEENAFQSHVRMYSPLAARAMTAGTRGQNSVVNFGPYAEFNKTASGEETKYADQKIGLLPQWATDTNITPDVRASLRTAPNTPEFKQFFRNSQVVDADGNPKVMYHGTARDISEFKPQQAGAIFITDNPETAARYSSESIQWVAEHAPEFLSPKQMMDSVKTAKSLLKKNGYTDKQIAALQKDKGFYKTDEFREAASKYLGSGENILPLYVRAENIFDYDNPDHVKAVMDKVRSLKKESFERVNNWTTIEAPEVQKAIKELGFDSFYVAEHGDKNLAVYEPTQIKSAIGNEGTYDIKNPDIRKSLRGKETIGINVNQDGNNKYADKIVDGKKTFETRDTDSLRPYVGQRVAIVKTGEGKAKAIGAVTIGEPILVTSRKDFDKYRNQTLVPKGSRFDIADDGVKYLYPMGNPERYKQEIDVGLGIVSRKVMQERASLRTNVKNDLSTMPNGAAILATMNRVTPPREKKGFAERVINALAPEASSYFRQNFLDRYNRLNDYDKMVAQQMGGVELLADQSSHWAALNSDMAAGVTASALGVGDRMGGAPVLKNGYVTVDNFNGTVKGVLEILSPLASRGDPDIYRLYQIWSAAKRGTRLYREGRFELLTPAEIKDALTLSQKYPEFVTVQQDWIKYNNALVKMQVDGGVITKEAGAEFMKYSDYIPLYRQMDGRTTLGPSVYQSISGVKPPKTLKGKGDAPIEDYLETIVRNTQAAIQSTMKNVAAQKAVKNGMMLGMVTRLPAVSSAPDTITVLENGKKVSYQCADKLFIEAVSSLNLPELPFLSILSAPADLLRSLVTKDPGFMLANMMRDSLSAYVTSGANIKPVISTVKNFGDAIMNRSPVYQALLNSGAIGGYEYSRNVEAGAEAFAADLRKKTGTETGSEKLFKPFTKVWGFLERGTEASDAATRMAVYEATLKETGNEAEAIRRAVEVLNFNRKGRSAIVRIAAAAIPFLNARVQGLDVFFRAGIRPFYDKNSTAYEKQVQKAMLIRGATMMALSTMYAAAIMGDPDYEKQEQETKDNNWLIPSLGIKLPIPFEVGVLFKTIPERIYRYSYGSDTSKDLGDSMKRALLSTFAFNPVPQAIAPLLEAQYNYSVFTQRPIVGEAMRNIAPEFQVGPSTTKIAEYLGKQTGMSPIMLDHVYKGYTGTMGMYLADVMDAVFTAGSDNPKASQRFEQTPVLKRFLLDPDARGQVSAYYDLKNSVDQTVRTVNLLSKQGSPELEGYIEKNISMYGMRSYISSVDKQMQKLSAQAAMIRSTPMPAEEKRKMLDEVTRLQNDLTNEIQFIKKMARP